MMPASSKTRKKMQLPTVICRPGFILPSNELSAASKQGASHTKKGRSKGKDSPTIPSKTKVSLFAVGTKSVDTSSSSSTQEIPRSKTPSKQQETQTKEGSAATDDHHASAFHATALSVPSIVRVCHGAHPPFAGVPSTFGSENAVSRGKGRRGKGRPSEYTLSENDGLSSGGSFRLATALQDRTNHGLDRKAPVVQQHVRCKGDVLPSLEKSVTTNDNGKVKAKVKSDRLVATKDCPQDRPGVHPSPPFPTFDPYRQKVTMIDRDLMIFVVDLVPPEICNVILGCTSRHVRCMEATGNSEKCWRSLYTYTKMDIPCAEVPGLGQIMHDIMLSVVRIIGDMYGKPQEASLLRPRSWKEPHLLMYQNVRGKMYVQCNRRS
jgi:hypothetical protein